MRTIFISLLVLFSTVVQAQPPVQGAVCVLPGTVYQYSIGLPPDSLFSLCVRGGGLQNGENCTATGIWQKYFHIIWKDSINMRIELTTGSGIFELPVKATTVLNGGQLNDSDLIKTFDGGSGNFMFRCTAASGGTCAPIYTYQWQRSINGLNWNNISGANERDLKFDQTVSVTTQFRRLTMEAGSNTIAYSNTALLLVE